jgi:wobble nucleotide-excising tRNase
MTKFALYIDGNEIKQADDPRHPTFKYSFSEGDKGALALAFFLTKLEVEGNLRNKIVVFDDPVSSFDLNRKTTTISKLLHFGEQSKQLFVLTHNIVFAGEFWSKTNRATSQCLRIESLTPSSVLIDFDINIESLSEVIKDSRLMKDFVTNGTIDAEKKRATARAIRPALESYFHLKFFDLLSDDDWLGDFVEQVRNCTPSDPFHRLLPQLEELTEINDYSKRFHHRFNSNADSAPLNDAELKTFCQRTLALIQLI